MSERAPYSRVYWAIADDPKFESVYDSDAHLATWLRLLMLADASWPASPPVPANARKASLKALSDAGLVDFVTGGRFRIHGLDSERGNRRVAATRLRLGQDPDGTQTGPRRDPDGTQTAFAPKAVDETRRDETHRAETTRAKTGERTDERTDLAAFRVITRRAPTPKQRRLLDDVLDRHDLTGPAWAADVMFRHPDDPIGGVIEADKQYRADRIQQAQEAESPTPSPQRPRSSPTSTGDILRDIAAMPTADIL